MRTAGQQLPLTDSKNTLGTPERLNYLKGFVLLEGVLKGGTKGDFAVLKMCVHIFIRFFSS